jgi:predicted N-acyltransferase
VGTTVQQAAVVTEVTVHRSVHELGRDCWDRLTAACDAPVFYGFDVLASIERAPLTAGAEAYYLVARRHGRPVAALPVYRQETVDPFEPGPAAPTRQLYGHFWHCYDTAVVGAAPEPWLVEHLCAALRQLAGELGARRWGLVNVPERSPLAAALGAVGLPGMATAPRYQLGLAGGPASVDEHLAGVGRSSRRTLRRYWRRAVADGVRVAAGPARDGLDAEALALCRATADKHAPGYYPPDRLRSLAAALGPAGRTIRVSLGGRLLGVSICLLDRSRMHAWAGGCLYPPELGWSPQYVLFHAELAAGIGSGRRTLECGRRNDDFKQRYGLARVGLARHVEGG